MDKTTTHHIDIPITCPGCGYKGFFSTWDCIDGSAHNPMRERLLHDETLFFYHCPQCGSPVHVETKCLYIDRERHVMVWHIPDLTMAVTSAEVEGFLETSDFSEYTCRVCLTWGEWREKIIEMEASYDDRLYEIIKYGSYQLLKDEQKALFPLEMYHLDYSDDTYERDGLSLVFMKDGEKGTGYVYPLTTTLLDITRDIFGPILERISANGGKGQFDRDGYAWAEKFMKYVIQGSQQKGMETYGKLLTFWIRTVGQEVFHQEIKG